VISEAAVGVATKIGAVALFAPIFLVPGLVITVTGIYLGNMYLKAQLSVKREMRYVNFFRRIIQQFIFIGFNEVMLDLQCSGTSSQLSTVLV
jgi:hypothetical protein